MTANILSAATRGQKESRGVDNLITQLFENQARRTPQRVALRWEDVEISYGDLNRRSNQLGHYLRRLGAGPEVCIGLCHRRSAELIVALFGILKAGAAYVPLDPAYPQARLDFMLRHAQVPVLLTESSLSQHTQSYRGETIQLDKVWDQIADENEANLEVHLDGDNLAYVIYTSGSSGEPKGVAVRLNSLTALVNWTQETFTEQELSGVLASTSISFDLSAFEIFACLSCGGRIVLVDNILALTGVPESVGVTLINTVGSLMTELLRRGALPQSVVTVNLAGEALPLELVKRLYRQKSIQRVYNLYGPSEDTTYSTYHHVKPEEESGIAAIGLPLPNTRMYLINEEWSFQQDATAGELYIGGDGLARGYINRPALTAERFLPDPFSNEPGARMYRTGDHVIRLSDGNLKFVGRLDEQIKLRGFRIELGEVESALTQHRNIRDAAVVVQKGPVGEDRLVAYTVIRQLPQPPVAELRNHLAQKLPEYMLPAQFVFLERLPRTPSGKISKRDLAAPDTTVSSVNPETAVEQALVAACSDVLGLPLIPLDASFLELGGTSLNATRFVAALQKVFQCDIPMRDLLSSKTLRELAADFEKYRTSLSTPAALDNSVLHQSPPAASFSQERVWFVQRIEPSNMAYCFTAQIVFHGELDIAAVEKALNNIIERHEIVRTTFAERAGRLFQIIHEPWKVEFNCRDMRGRSKEAYLFLQEDSRAPFDLGTLPLVRWRIIRLEDKKYLFQSVEHHMIHDGWSYNVFLKELTHFYKAFTVGSNPDVHPSPLQFAAFARWEREWIVTPAAQEQMRYWSEKLIGVPPLLLPCDRIRPKFQTYRGDIRRVNIDEDLYKNLHVIARRGQVTPFILCIAAFQILLFRYSGQNDFCIGTGIANRRRPETADLIGMVVNNIALRVHTDMRSSVAAVVNNVREAALGAYSNQDLPFDKVVQVAKPVRDVSYNPIFQVMLSFHDSPVKCAELGELTMEIEQALNNGSAKFDVNIVIIPPQSHNLPAGHRPQAKMLWEYNTDLFDADTIDRMIADYLRVLSVVVSGRDVSIADIELMKDAEQPKTVLHGNSTMGSYWQSQSRGTDGSSGALPDVQVLGKARHLQLLEYMGVVHEIVEKQARRVPEEIAVTDEDEQLTYRMLNRRANQLAHYLQKCGAGLEVKVGVCLGRSPEAVVAFLAVLKTGSAYVPLDPHSPSERLDFMVNDADVRIVITEERYGVRLGTANVPILYLDQLRKVLEAEPEINLELEVSPENLAYVMYTSGSTGVPKGVGTPHRAIVRLVFGGEYVRLGREECLLQMAPLSFDAATFELWGALLHGGRLVIYPEGELELKRLDAIIKANGVTCVWLTASVFNLIIDVNAQVLAKVSQILTGGEALSVAHIERALEQLTGATIINGYGPTEGTTFTSCYRIPRPRPIRWSSIPIGTPLDNTEILILDDHGQPTPPEVTGELYIGGAGLARGYLNRPDLTAEKFVPHPFSAIGGQRLYRSGDMARWRADGLLEFMGRADRQVKIRGFRIEPEEIERVLEQQRGIREAVVAATEDMPGNKRLVAYVVAQQTKAQEKLDVEELRLGLQKKLPEYMIPSVFILLEELPRTPNGKVDRKVLADTKSGQALGGADYVMPRTETEELLAAIWSALLGVERIGVHDDFFRLGGHSLLGTQVMARVRDALAVEMPLRAFFEHRTISGLARAIENERSRQKTKETWSIHPQPRSDCMPLSFNEEVLWTMAQQSAVYLAFASQMAARVWGELKVEFLQKAFKELMARHEILRTTFATKEGHPVRVIAPVGDAPMAQMNLAGLEGNRQEEQVRQIAIEELTTPFDLARGPLLRIKLLKLRKQEHVLLLTMHHIVTDGWSLGILSRELRLLYQAYVEGRQVSLPQLRIQYADYAMWKRGWLQGEAFNQLLGYWMKRLAGVTNLPRLPADRSPSASGSLRESNILFAISKERTEQLRALSWKAGVTPFITLLAIFKLWLHQYTGAKDLAVGVPLSERSRSELEGMIGLLVNMVVLHTNVGDDPSFDTYLRQLHRTSQEAYAHQDLPFGVVHRALGNPGFSRAMFDYINVPDYGLVLPGLKSEPLYYRGNTPFLADVILFLRERKESIDCTLAYKTELFTEQRMLAFTEQFTNLVGQVLQDPGKRLSQYSHPRKVNEQRDAES